MMSFVVIGAFLLGVTCGLPTGKETYLNHRLVDVNVTSEEQRQYIDNLANVGHMGLDIWLTPTLIQTGRLRVPPESFDLFMELMAKADISTEVRHNNLKQMMDEVAAMPRNPTNYNDFMNGLLTHNKYYRFGDILEFVSHFDGSDGFETKVLNNPTIKGSSTPIVEITGGSSSSKKKIFIEAGIHAREWISPASALYFIDRLYHRRRIDADAMKLYNDFDWYIVPVANPDGYEYTHTNSRFWRKNMKPVCGGNTGVDLNRNFDAEWGGSGSSGDCQSDLYRGTAPFSEIESQNIRDKIREIKAYGPIAAYLSIHSFSQLLLTNYGFAEKTYPSNINSVNETTHKARDAIMASSSRTYRVGSPPDLLYVADGGSHDWARYTECIPYAMTYELRPATGNIFGFVLPTSEIAPCSKEVWDSIYAIVTNLSDEVVTDCG